MSRFERCLLYGMSAIVLAGLLASTVGGLRGQSLRPVVQAADCHDNHRLDVLRRAISYAQSISVNEDNRALELEKSSLSLGQLQGIMSYGLKIFMDEHRRAVQLDKSSVPGDRSLAKDAFQRAQEWHKVEQQCRAIYMAEVQRVLKEADKDRSRAREAQRRAEEWRKSEQELRRIFTTEVERMKKETGTKSSTPR